MDENVDLEKLINDIEVAGLKVHELLEEQTKDVDEEHALSVKISVLTRCLCEIAYQIDPSPEGLLRAINLWFRQIDKEERLEGKDRLH